MTTHAPARPSTWRRSRLGLMGAALSLVAAGVTTTVTTGTAHAATWTQIAGSAKDVGVAVGTNGAVWAIGFSDSHVYRRNGTAWDAAGLTGNRVSVDASGNAWVVRSDGSIWLSNAFGQPWGQWPGSARDIAIAPNGGIWAAGTDGIVWQWTGASWTSRGGSLANRIDVDSAGTVWVVQTTGAVFRRTTANPTWVAVAGTSQDIGGGSGGAAWRAGTGTDGTIFRRSSLGTWVNESGVGKSVDVDNSGRAWVTQSNGNIWRSN